MGYSTRYDDGRDVVWIVFTGDVNEDLVEGAAVAATALALQNACHRFLADTQGVKGPLQPLEIVRVAASLGDLGLPERHKVALVAGTLEIADDLFEIAATRAGFTLQAFATEAEAFSWLDEE